MKLNSYLMFDGNCEEAMNYYKDIFDGEFSMVMRYKDGPPEYSSPGNENQIMHLTMQFQGIELLASDAMTPTLTKGNNNYLSINVDNEEDGLKIFNSLADGGVIEMPFEEVFWGGKFGSLKDKFGVMWMVSAEHTKNV